MKRIHLIKGREILESRGNPTVEAEVILEDGRLAREQDGFLIYFERSDIQIELPSAPVQPEALVGNAQPEAPVQSAQAGLLGVKYVCVNADVSGFTMEASMLGGEYSMIFHEGGALDFVVVGSAMPGLTWTTLDSGNFSVDFYGNKLEIIWTEAGFDMNYMDAMLMHFVPEA